MPLDIKGFPRTGIWREYAATRTRIDLLHEPEPSAGILRLARYPLVLTVHDLAPMIFPHMFRRTHAWTFRRLVPRNVSRADAIIADSEHTRRDLERFVPGAARKTRVVHLAGQSLSADTEVQGAVKPEHPYILSVATVEPRKNHIALLDAYQILRERGTDVRLVLTGRAGWANSNVYRHPALEVVRRSDSLYRGRILRGTGWSLPERAGICVSVAVRGLRTTSARSAGCGCSHHCWAKLMLPGSAGRCRTLRQPPSDRGRDRRCCDCTDERRGTEVRSVQQGQAARGPVQLAEDGSGHTRGLP